MNNTIIIDKHISDVNLIVQSDNYIKYVFDNPSIIKENDNTMKILAKYNKDKTLSKYDNNDFINLVKTLFAVDDIVLTVHQNIISNDNRANDKTFTIRQVLHVECDHNDIFFAAMLSNFKILIEINVSEYNNMTNMTFDRIEIIENNDFNKNKRLNEISDIDKYELQKISIKKYLNNYNTKKNNFFHSDIQYSDNIIINILNIIVNNAMTSEYMRNICEYFAWSNIDIYSLSKSS